MDDPLYDSLRQTRGAFIRTSVLLFVNALLLASSPYLLMVFFDHVTSGTPSFIPAEVLKSVTDLGVGVFESEALVFACVMILLGAVSSWLARLEETEPLACALSAISSWRKNLLQQLLRGRINYFETHSAHEMAARVSDDGITVEILLVTSLKAFAKSLPLLGLMLAALVVSSPVLAIAFFLAAVPFYIVAASFVRADWVRSKRSDQETNHYRHEIQHSLFMLASLKSLSVEDEALDQLAIRAERSDEQALLSRRARGSLAATIVSAKHILRASLVIFGAWLILTKNFSIGPFLMFAIYSELMPAAVIELARCVALARTAAPALERLRGLAASLENGEETEGSRKTSSLPFPDAGALSFEDVALSPGGPIFSAVFEPGELIAVVGTQSSGRSTFGRYLNRLSDPPEGSIQIGRTQLKSFSLALLRQIITLVDRSPYFMTASVRDNLALAIQRDTDLNERSVSKAFSDAGVDFVGDLPDKLDTVIGEMAYRLSDSQTQKLSVARALLRADSRIFFFDEVTAGLEATEARTIFEAVQSLAESGAIVFWVTRRAEEANECDRIVFLEQKPSEVIVTIETPEALLARSEPYRRVLGLRDNRIFPLAQTAPVGSKASSRERNDRPDFSV